jgi:hypothetical protein
VRLSPVKRPMSCDPYVWVTSRAFQHETSSLHSSVPNFTLLSLTPDFTSPRSHNF